MEIIKVSFPIHFRELTEEEKAAQKSPEELRQIREQVALLRRKLLEDKRKSCGERVSF